MYEKQFINYLQQQKRYSQHTAEAYRGDIEQFIDFLASEEIDDVTEVTGVQVRNYMAALMDAGNNERTVGRKLSALRSFFKYLLRGGYIKKDPMLLVKTPKVPKHLPVFVEAQRMDQLLDRPENFANGFAGMRDKLVIELLFGTGMRLAELISLTDADVNMYDGSVKVMGKRNKERVIPVAKPLMAQIEKFIALKTLQNLNNNKGQLIVTDKGMPAYPKLIYRIVNKYLDTISTQDKKSPHVLRHSYATALLNRGADLNAIKELLGHASLAATQVYVHNSVERIKAIYKQAHPKA